MYWRSLLFTLILLTSCSGFFKKKTERPLARVYDDYLYASDMKGVVTPGLPANDSIMIVKSYVDNWVRQRLILHQAGKTFRVPSSIFRSSSKITRTPSSSLNMKTSLSTRSSIPWLPRMRSAIIITPTRTHSS